VMVVIVPSVSAWFLNVSYHAENAD
jgi:hypothetical protein